MQTLHRSDMPFPGVQNHVCFFRIGLLEVPNMLCLLMLLRLCRCLSEHRSKVLLYLFDKVSVYPLLLGSVISLICCYIGCQKLDG